MKAFQIFSVLVSAAFFSCGEISAVFAADVVQGAPEETLQLESVLERIKQMDDDFVRQAVVFVAVVDAEGAAKRISKGTIQLLYALARAPRFDINELTKNIPQDNVVIVNASKELDVAYKLFRVRMNTVTSAMSKELRRRIKDAVIGKPTLEEITALTKTTLRLQSILEQRGYNVGSKANGYDENSIPWEYLTGLLGAARQLVESEGGQSQTSLSAALDALRKQTMRESLVSRDEIQARITRAVEPMGKTIEKQADAIEAMIDARKPAQEIAAAIDGYTQALKQFNAMSSGGDDFRMSGSGNAIGYYTALAGALKSLGNGDYQEADQNLKSANNQRQQYGSAVRGVRDQFVTKVQKMLQEKMTATREQSVAEIVSRMTAVKEAADITALIPEIEKRSRQLRTNDSGGNNDELARLMEPLRELQRAWAMNNVQALLQQEQMLSFTQRDIPAVFGKEFSALRKRISRIVYSGALKTPEINAAPYAEKETEAAIQSFCDDLAQRGEWRRLFDTFQLRQAVDQKYNDDMSAISSFLTGKNSELAEQWLDALLAYKNVLRSTAKRAPIQAAAERIKEISKAHPEAAKELAEREKSGAGAKASFEQKAKAAAAVGLSVGGFTN